jgi:excisionase family DNA binding protein
MEALIKATTKTDQRIALDSLIDFLTVSRKVKSSREKSIRINILETDELITIPASALTLLYAILQNMAEGKAISIIPSDSEVSTQQAAELLNVSRPHLIKLLEAGKIPFKKVGSHRRILLKELITYDEKQKKDRENQLDFLSKQAQELNLGYE